MKMKYIRTRLDIKIQRTVGKMESGKVHKRRCAIQSLSHKHSQRERERESD
jgi:hypothetical protein